MAFLVGTFFGFGPEVAQLSERSTGRRSWDRSAGAAVATLGLRGVKGAFGAGEQRRGFAADRGHDGGDADRDRVSGLGGVVHGFDDFFADTPRPGRRGGGETSDEIAVGAAGHPIAVAGAMDTQGAVQVSDRFAMVSGLRMLERHDEESERHALGGAAAPFAAEVLCEL